MSKEKQLMLAHKNLISFIDLNDKQIRKYCNLEVTPTKISFTVQKIVLVLDSMYKVASFSNNFNYKNIANSDILYDIIGDYLIEVLYENEELDGKDFFPDYLKFKEHSDLIIQTLFKKLIATDDTFRDKIHNN